MNAEQLLNSLIATARNQEQAIHDDLLRLKERDQQVRQHRMELESVADAFKAQGGPQ